MQIYAKNISDISIELPPGFLTGEFAKTSPIGRIPALDIDGDIIPESEVISEYLEEIYPEPSLLGSTPRETAQIRTVARIADIYVMNNMFMVLPQVRRSTRNEAIRDLLTKQVLRGVKALEHYIGDQGFAVGKRLTIADCTVVPALFLVDNVLPTLDVENPIPSRKKVAAYWAAIQSNEYASRTLVELHRGLAERRALTTKAKALESDRRAPP